VLAKSVPVPVEPEAPSWRGVSDDVLRFETVALRVLCFARGLRSHASCCTGAILLLACLGATSIAQSTPLPPPWQQKTEANSFSNKRTVPRVDRGYLYSFRRLVFDRTQSNLFVRSLASGEEQQLTFWVNDASEIRAEDVSINANGQIYLAGSLLRPGQLALTNFVAEMDRSGAVTKIVDLGSYRPKRVCATNDGSFWTFGQVLNGDNEAYRGQLLREYAVDGRLLNAYLPIGKFPKLAHADYRRSSATLVCGDESVGLYLAHPARWVEVQLSNHDIYKWRIQPAPAGKVTGIALMGTHQVYASFATKSTGSDGKAGFLGRIYKLTLPAEAQTPSSGLTLDGGRASFAGLSLRSGERAKGAWTELSVSSVASGGVFLLGRDDQSLVYVGRRSGGGDSTPAAPRSSGDPTLYWVRP
jgi:hypothetical protein